MRRAIGFLCAMICWAGAIAPAPAMADGRAGAAVFASKCAACHSNHRGVTLVGPSLAGVFGRKAGALKDFPYSPAMRASPIVWGADTLDAFIAQPRRIIPGITMTAPGIADATQRADLIAYLATLR